jgi:hypothetical protein
MWLHRNGSPWEAANEGESLMFTHLSEPGTGSQVVAVE